LVFVWGGGIVFFSFFIDLLIINRNLPERNNPNRGVPDREAEANVINARNRNLNPNDSLAGGG
jgi:hypothetical protein